METTRQQKFARLIQKELSQLFLHDGPSIYGKAFVTITTVKATPDLSIARVYLSIMGVPDREQAVEAINGATHKIRGLLGLRIKQQVRHIPNLNFFLDDSLDYAEKIERLLKEANAGKDSAN
jgi:ribosome-binding factor A